MQLAVVTVRGSDPGVEGERAGMGFDPSMVVERGNGDAQMDALDLLQTGFFRFQLYTSREGGQAGRFIEVNSTLASWLGCRGGRVVTPDPASLKLIAKLAERLAAAPQLNDPLQYEVQLAETESELCQGPSWVRVKVVRDKGHEQLPIDGSICCGVWLGIVQNVSADKEREQKLASELAEAEKKRDTYMSYLESFPGGFVVYRSKPDRLMDGACEYISPNISSVLGYTADELITNPSLMRDLNVREDIIPYMDSLCEAAKDSIPLALIYRKGHKDGHRVWIENYVQPCKVEADGSQAWIGFMKDHSARKSLEEELRNSRMELQEQRDYYKALLSCIPAYVWKRTSAKDDLNNVSNFQYLNHEHTPLPLFQEVFSGLAEGADGRTRVLASIPQEDLAVGLEAYRKSMIEGLAPITFRYQSAAGGTRWFSGFVSPVSGLDESENSQSWIGCALDITDQKQAQQELHSSQLALKKQRDEYQQLLSCLPAGVLKFQARAEDCSIQSVNYVNDKLIDLQGRTLEEINDDLRNGVHMINAEYRQLLSAAMMRCLAGKEPSVTQAVRLARKDHGIIWARVFLAPLELSEENGMQIWLGVIFDITEIKRQEEALRQSQKRIQEQEAMKEIAAAAEKANRAKSEFLATMSHEIRTPLHAVIGMGDLLLATHLTAEQKSFVSIICSSGQALLSIINAILDLSKLDAGRMLLEERHFDVRGCIETAMDQVARQAFDKGLEMAYFMDPSMPDELMGDDHKILQIALNLLSNAVKFTHQGSIRVSVDLQHEGDKSFLHISVADTGIGIPADRRGLLFQAFSQLDASTTRQFGGTGLGLLICYKLCELMGGRIWLDEKDDGTTGTVFHFNVAVKVPPTAVDLERVSRGCCSSVTYLVNDGHISMSSMRRMLQASAPSMDCISVPNVSEALSMVVSKAHPDLSTVVVDALQLALAGDQVSQQLQQAVQVGRILLVVLVSQYQMSEFGGTLMYGETLAKPVKAKQLRSLLRAHNPSLLPSTPTDSLCASPVSPFAQADFAKSHPLRILIAEDNIVNQLVITKMMTRLGYTPDVAKNGKLALDLVRQKRYDVILMDMHMPIMDGTEATRLIKKMPNAPIIVAVTAAALLEERDACMEAGMDMYLTKPLKLQVLQETLRECHVIVADNGARKVIDLNMSVNKKLYKRRRMSEDF